MRNRSRSLIRQVANASLYHNESTKMLFEACYEGYSVEKIKDLIRAGANVNASVWNDEILQIPAANDFAVRSGIALMLAGEGVSYRSSELKGLTPLHIAVEENHVDIVRCLLEAGSDVHALTGFSNNSCLHLLDDDKGCAELLLSYGAVVTVANQWGNTPLLTAAQNGYLNVVKVLLNNGCSVDEKNWMSQSVLHLAAQSGNLALVKYLLKRGARLDGDTKWGDSVIHDAARSQNAELLSMLLQKGAPIKPRLSTCDILMESCTPYYVNGEPDYDAFLPLLHKAIQFGPKQLVKQVLAALKEEGEEDLTDALRAKNRKGETAFQSLLCHFPSLVKKHLDESLQEVKSCSETYLKVFVNFSFLSGGFATVDLDPLYDMVQYKQKQLLQHPVCQTLLHLKWLQVRGLYYFAVVFNFSFPMLLSLHFMNIHPIYSDDPPVCGYADVLFRGVISFLCAFDMLLLVSKGMRYKVTDLLRDLENFMRVFIAASTFPLMFAYLDWCKLQLSSLTVLASWVRCMVFLGRIPFFGLHLLMYASVLRTMCAVLIAYSWIHIGFTLGFMVLFKGAKPFETFHNSMLYTLAMLLGEFEVQETFIDGGLLDITCPMGFVLLMAFFLFMSLVMVNLVVGLSVSNIEELKEHALLEKSVKNMRLVRAFDLMVAKKMWLKMITMCSGSAPSDCTILTSAHRTCYYLNPNDSHSKNILFCLLESKIKKYVGLPFHIAQDVQTIITKRKVCSETCGSTCSLNITGLNAIEMNKGINHLQNKYSNLLNDFVLLQTDINKLLSILDNCSCNE